MKTEVFCPPLLPVPNAASEVSLLPNFIMYIQYMFLFSYKVDMFWFTYCDLVKKISWRTFPTSMFTPSNCFFASCGYAIMNQKHTDGRLGCLLFSWHHKSPSGRLLLLVTWLCFGSDGNAVFKFIISSWNPSYAWRCYRSFSFLYVSIKLMVHLTSFLGFCSW